jgi:hypothetical protein
MVESTGLTGLTTKPHRVLPLQQTLCCAVQCSGPQLLLSQQKFKGRLRRRVGEQMCKHELLARAEPQVSTRPPCHCSSLSNI